VKADAGIYGNEIADRLAKWHLKTATSHTAMITNNAIKQDTRKESIRKWQNQWRETTERTIVKEFFPSV